MGSNSVQPDAIEDRPLTDEEKARIATGGSLPMGNGNTRPSFADLPPETLAEYHRRRIDNLRRKKETAQFAQLQAYMEAHREHASELLGAKIAILNGLMTEMQVIDDKTGALAYDTRLLDAKRLKVLTQAINDFEKMAYTADGKKSEQTVTINVAHVVADLRKSLTK